MAQPADTPKTVAVATLASTVREGFATALGAAGHRVVEVGTHDDLLARLRSPTDVVDLVALDLTLDGRGVEGVRALRTAFPQTPIVVFGGSVRDAADVRALASLGITSYINEHSSTPHILPALAPLLFPDSFNRRISPRVTLDIALSYRVGESLATALTLNVSKGGLGVRTMTPLEPGTKVSVRFRLPGTRRDIEAASRVAWRDHRSGMGLQFEKMSPTDQSVIDEFVDRQAATETSPDPGPPASQA